MERIGIDRRAVSLVRELLRTVLPVVEQSAEAVVAQELAFPEREVSATGTVVDRSPVLVDAILLRHLIEHEGELIFHEDSVLRRGEILADRHDAPRGYR